MSSSIGRVAWECFLDLGITVVYATIAGLLIVGVAATDDGPGSLLTTALYASLLPASVTLLIGFDVGVRVVGERRRRTARVPARALGLSRS